MVVLGRLHAAGPRCPAEPHGAAAATCRHTKEAPKAARSARHKAVRQALHCQSEASCAGHYDRSSSPPPRWHEVDGYHHRTSLPEEAEPSTSGRSNAHSHQSNSSSFSSSDSINQLCSGSSTQSSGNLSQDPATEDAHGYEETWDLPDDEYTPFPSNCPTNSEAEALSSSELFKRSRSYLGMQPSNDRWCSLTQVWVLLFGVGTRETEGIYSLRAMSRDKGVPQDTIIAFEDPEDAERYSGLLEATMEHVPHVSPINVPELLEFCSESGYKCRLEPRGTLLLPPDYNIGLTDWERSLRLREGNFTVLDDEPERQPGDDPAAEEAGMQAVSDHEPPKLHNNAGVGPATDIEDWRARFERLIL